MKLKETLGVWVDKSFQIESMLVNDFTTRFKFDQGSPPNVEVDMANLVIFVDNENLLEPIHV